MCAYLLFCAVQYRLALPVRMRSLWLSDLQRLRRASLSLHLRSRHTSSSGARPPSRRQRQTTLKMHEVKMQDWKMRHKSEMQAPAGYLSVNSPAPELFLLTLTLTLFLTLTLTLILILALISNLNLRPNVCLSCYYGCG